MNKRGSERLERRKPVVLHVVEAFGGGVRQSIESICHGLSDRFDFVILYGCRSGGLENEFSSFPKGTRFSLWNVKQTLSLKENLDSILQLRALVQEVAPIRVHAHSSTAGGLARLAFPMRSQFVVYSPRGYAFLRKDVSRVTRFIYSCIEWLLGHALPHPVIACGYDEFMHTQNMARGSICIPNSLDVKAIDAIVTDVQRKKNGEPLTVVDAGRIVAQKNFPLFVRIAEAFKGDPSVRFLWIGGGHIDAVLGDKCLPDNITITGWVSHAEGIRKLADSDIFLHTALWEGFARVCLEAGALRLPLLLYTFDGAFELMSETRKTGYICESEAAFVEKIRLLLSDLSLRKYLGENARLHVEKHYSAKSSNDMWAKLYTTGLENF